jgi:hypothetical protein
MGLVEDNAVGWSRGQPKLVLRLDNHLSTPTPVARREFIMGRTRPKTRKARLLATELTEALQEKKSEPTVQALLEKAHELIVQCDYHLAGRFVERVLQRTPDNAEAKEILGVVQLETGLLDKAKQVCRACYLDSCLVFTIGLSDFLIIATATSRCTIPTTACRASVSRPAQQQ